MTVRPPSKKLKVTGTGWPFSVISVTVLRSRIAASPSRAGVSTHEIGCSTTVAPPSANSRTLSSISAYGHLGSLTRSIS